MYPPQKIPACDVLELDCEGAEIEIIESINFTPRALIVELHPWSFNYEYENILSIMSSNGYYLKKCYGHEGNEVGPEESKIMYNRSKNDYDTYMNGTDDMDIRFIEGVARWPMVMAFSRNE